jgi:VanZ family protein
MARRWLPPLVWAACILVTTSIPGAHLPRVDVPGLDKAVHLGLYGVLGWLAARAVWTRGGGARDAAFAFVAIAVFGALDEWHQQFIPGRSMEFLDWVADSTGALAGVAVAALTRRREARS